jgi:NAD(P)-dependent dehydrogenase (short-subunit alcohol dehydrogenase family)
VGRELEGQVALVTGASKGIGKAIAAAFADAGAAVMLSSRKQEGLDEAAAAILQTTPGARISTYAANAGDPDQAASCVATTVEQLGGLDILVNNAATNPYMGPSVDIDLGRYDKTFEVNLRGVVVWIQQAWHQAMKDTGGSIVNMASIGGLSAESSIGIYNATKAGLLHMTRLFASELAPGVRVNAIAPGLVKTDMARSLWEPAEEQIARHTPLRRLGEPQDIANAALFLASDLASWITGTTMIVDGGAMLGR